VELFALTASTVDGVAVGRGYALVDNGIETRERSAGVAWHAPESVGAGHESRGGSDGSDGLHSCGGEGGVRGSVIVVVLFSSCVIGAVRN
jgi:hypothetical protein